MKKLITITIAIVLIAEPLVIAMPQPTHALRPMAESANDIKRHSLTERIIGNRSYNALKGLTRVKDIGLATFHWVTSTVAKRITAPGINFRLLDMDATIDNSIDNIEELIVDGKIKPIESLDSLSDAPPAISTMVDFTKTFGLEDESKFSEKEITRIALTFLSLDKYVVLKKVISEALGKNVKLRQIQGPVDLILAKHGSFECIYQLVIRLKGRQEPLLVAFHLPMDSIANQLLRTEVENQLYFRMINPAYIPKLYLSGGIIRKDETKIYVYVNKWMVGYHELHISQRHNGRRFILWGKEGGKSKDIYIEDDMMMRKMMVQIYKILTVYNEIGINTVVLNAGDFIGKINPDGEISIYLVTARRKNATPAITYQKDFDKVTTDGAVEFLKDLLTIRVRDFEVQYDLADAHRRIANGEANVSELVRIADFYTVLEGFHLGVMERLANDGLALERLVSTSAFVAEKAFLELRDDLVSGRGKKTNAFVDEYIDEHSAEIIGALDRYLKNVIYPLDESLSKEHEISEALNSAA